MNVSYPSDHLLSVGDMVEVKRIGMPEVEIPNGKITPAGSDNDIAVWFVGKVTKISESGKDVEELIITQSPEIVKFDDDIHQLKFNEQFKVGMLINAAQLKAKNLEYSVIPEPKSLT
ncbi:hypothetical protein [Anabaena sp. PCC 7108]|uniref:hypothetical protein n=1 Tax=Anabaena sp. PCC 7108 TaxID=163908 RepID=UPI000364B9FC|nr:hypothetical protein [Anabaena sp. PCC 7108]